MSKKRLETDEKVIVLQMLAYAIKRKNNKEVRDDFISMIGIKDKVSIEKLETISAKIMRF